jgi:hypothetical protein
MEQRFGAEAVTELTSTSLQGLQAWTYGFRWDEEDGQMERAALLLPVAGATYRTIYDPRSDLNDRVIATLTVGD